MLTHATRNSLQFERQTQTESKRTGKVISWKWKQTNKKLGYNTHTGQNTSKKENKQISRTETDS